MTDTRKLRIKSDGPAPWQWKIEDIQTGHIIEGIKSVELFIEAGGFPEAVVTLLPEEIDVTTYAQVVQEGQPDELVTVMMSRSSGERKIKVIDGINFHEISLTPSGLEFGGEITASHEETINDTQSS